MIPKLIKEIKYVFLFAIRSFYNLIFKFDQLIQRTLLFHKVCFIICTYFNDYIDEYARMLFVIFRSLYEKKRPRLIIHPEM